MVIRKNNGQRTQPESRSANNSANMAQQWFNNLYLEEFSGTDRPTTLEPEMTAGFAMESLYFIESS